MKRFAKLAHPSSKNWAVGLGLVLLSLELGCPRSLTPTELAAREKKAAQECDMAALGERDTNFAFVSYLFCRLLTRPADDKSRDFFMGQLKNGLPRTDLMKEFVRSDEFQRLGSTSSGPEYVRFLFRFILSREPSQNEISRWTERMEKGKWDRARLAEEIGYSLESRQKNHL